MKSCKQVILFYQQLEVTHTKSEMIMCVLNTKDYFLLKELVLDIDPHAFIVVNDCYDVNGGVKKKSLPFL